MARGLIFNVGARSSALHAGATIIDVEGEVDVLTSPRFKTALAEAIDLGSSTIIINLDKVQYMDSTGLGVLVSAMKRVRERDGVIVLTGLNSHLGKIFEITGLRKVFNVYASESEALDACLK